MSYQFELTHSKEHFEWQNKLLFDFYNKPLLKLSLILSGLAMIFLCIGLLKTGLFIESFEFTLFLFFIVFAILIVYQFYKAKAKFKIRLAELEPKYQLEPHYCIWLNDEKFGSKDCINSVEYSWSKNTVLKRFKDALIIQTYPRSQHLIMITATEAGKDKLKEIEQYVIKMIRKHSDEEVV